MYAQPRNLNDELTEGCTDGSVKKWRPDTDCIQNDETPTVMATWFSGAVNSMNTEPASESFKRHLLAGVR